MAAAALKHAGFKSKTVTTPTTEAAQVGVVLKQSPAGGAKARKGATVTITVGAQSDDHADHAHHAADHAHPAGDTARHRMSAGVDMEDSVPGEALAVAVLAGGRSSEHDVSLSSGAAVREGCARPGTRSCGWRSAATACGAATGSR